MNGAGYVATSAGLAGLKVNKADNRCSLGQRPELAIIPGCLVVGGGYDHEWARSITASAAPWSVNRSDR